MGLLEAASATRPMGTRGGTVSTGQSTLPMGKLVGMI